MWKAVLALALAPLLGGCASWTAVQRESSWTLYVKDGEKVDIDRFGRALTPAFEAVEARMGPFARAVRVHALDPEDPKSAPPDGPSTSELQLVPGIGPARVRAYHVRGGALSFQPSGVFLGTSDVGTAVHELVHARIAELGLRLPLWFEEGLASLWGDGAEFEGRWVVDGLACWPLRELRDVTFSDAELERLLSLSAGDDYDSRDNLLAHFVGWAILFDLSHEEPDLPWSAWYANFERESRGRGRARVARECLERTLARSTEKDWLERLRADDPGVRLAAARGLWKLRSAEVIDRILDALEHESHPEVRVAFALNVLLSTGETRLGRSRWNRLSSLVFPALREGHLRDADEQQALAEVYESMRRWNSRGGRNAQRSLDALARLWEE